MPSSPHHLPFGNQKRFIGAAPSMAEKSEKGVHPGDEYEIGPLKPDVAS
jgi:hypothetical protein